MGPLSPAFSYLRTHREKCAFHVTRSATFVSATMAAISIVALCVLYSTPSLHSDRWENFSVKILIISTGCFILCAGPAFFLTLRKANRPG